MNRIASLVAAVALTVPAAALAQDTCNQAGLIEEGGTERSVNFSAAVPSLIAYHGVYGTYPIEREAAQAMSPAIRTADCEAWISLDRYAVSIDRMGGTAKDHQAMTDATARALYDGAMEVAEKADGVNADIDALKKQMQVADEEHAAVKAQLQGAQRMLAWHSKSKRADRRTVASLKAWIDALEADLAAAEAEVQEVSDALNAAVEHRSELAQASDSMKSGSDVFKTLSCVLGVAAGTDP
jgi:hypothetical protein